MSEEIKETRKVWLVEHPTYQFKEDVKKLARKNDLIIVDAKFKDQYKPEQLVSDKDAPKLTPIKKADGE